MSEKKGWARGLKGLFIEPDESADGTAAEAPAEGSTGDAAPPAAGGPGDGAPLDAVGPDGTAFPLAGRPGAPLAPGAPGVAGDLPRMPAAAPGGKLDFAAIYTAAGIGPEEQERFAKAAELLHALPAGTEAARQIVEASLKAFGVPVEKIVAAGEREIQALDAYAEANAADTRKVLDESNRRIAQYEQEIQRIRQAMDEQSAAQQAVARSCAGGKLDVARVLGFFGHAPAGAVPSAAAPPANRRETT